MKVMDKYQLPINIGAIALLVSEIILSALSIMGIVHVVWVFVLLSAFAVAGMCYTQFDPQFKTQKSL